MGRWRQPPDALVAVVVSADVVLRGVAIPRHRTLEVVDEPPAVDGEERSVLSAGEARALVGAGLAEPVVADFDRLEPLIESWRAA